jgi:hypothetical protein
MKFCPTCETRYDEEILRFCTKDGTPLIDDDQPNFVDSSSTVGEAEEMDFGEETVIRFEKPSVPVPPADPEIDRSEAPRIVIPMTEERPEQRVRARNIPPYMPLQPKANTAKVVALTILGTVGVLLFGFALFYLLQSDDQSANTNLNVNTNPPNTNLNLNLNTNVGLGNYNFNINTNGSYNSNLALNLNVSTNANRTPTPKPSPSPTPSLSPTPTANLNANTPVVSSTPSTPRPTATPAAPPKPSPSVKPSSNTNH